MKLYVVDVQWRQRNVQKSVMHVQSCCFANLSYCFFFAVLVAVVVIFVAKAPFCNLIRLSLQWRNRTNSRLKNLTGHFVLAEQFSTFALGSHGTDESAWILTLAFFSSCGFTICPCTERYLSKSEMTSPNWTATHPRNHAFNVQKFRRSWYSQRAGQTFDRTSQNFDLHFGLQIFWTARRLNFRTVSVLPCELKT